MEIENKNLKMNLNLEFKIINCKKLVINRKKKQNVMINQDRLSKFQQKFIE